MTITTKNKIINSKENFINSISYFIRHLFFISINYSNSIISTTINYSIFSILSSINLTITSTPNKPTSINSNTKIYPNL
jgi:hypothetical protein